MVQYPSAELTRMLYAVSVLLVVEATEVRNSFPEDEQGSKNLRLGILDHQRALDRETDRDIDTSVVSGIE